ncbi:MAG: MYXO-CTERM sorting domain-containing protein [Myxococcota bacterium]
MKRIFLTTCALAAVLAPSTASAEPGVLYIPTDPVTLRPTGVAPCGSGVNSATGCGGASMEVEEPPFAGAADLTTGMADALAAYDVHVTNTRPPEYISYTMLLPGDEPLDPKSAGIRSFTCAFGGINCAARGRNDIVSTSGSTDNCTDPDVLHAALYAFGRNSGLEGIDNPEDWMNYPPDYTTLPMGFQDSCSDRLNQFGFNDRDMQIELPLECTSVDHVECPDGTNGDPGQNSHLDMVEFYGDVVEDTDPPELTNIVPEDGAILMEGDDLVLDVDVADSDPVVGLRWIIQSDAIVSDMFPDGTISQCTNDVCNVNWEDAAPLKATESDWIVTLGGLPAGAYAITLEASDYHGNVSEMVSINVTIEGSGGGDETAGDETAGEGGDETAGEGGGVLSEGATDASEGGDTTPAGDDGDDTGGCACTTGDSTPAAPALMLLGLMGLGAMRRRW